MDVSLIVMPFASFRRPAIGVSLLKAALTQIGISSKIYYFNLKFAERIGLKLYSRIAEYEYAGSSLLGELVFAAVMNNGCSWQKEHFERELYEIFSKYYLEWTEKKKNDAINDLMYTEQFVFEFIRECSREILRERPRLIGFTSTFHQNCSSLALAKTIKSQADIPIIFGGANCEGEMGSTLLKVAPWVDFICSGEGDIAFTEFTKVFFGYQPKHKINGILTRESNHFDSALTNPVLELDSLPFPDFDDYFTACDFNNIRLSPSLVIETSRGCWWGEKYQCTFCGLNGSNIQYRSKSVERVLNELEYMVTKYNNRKFQVVDNILDLKYTNTLFPKISSSNLKVDLFYETKSNLSKGQLLIMKKGGVTRVQPGIESLSDVVLAIMKKGVSALNNIQILKWCREINIKVLWNIIWGFPGEPPEEYDHMSEIIPLLVHLDPPNSFGKIILDRFSPYYMEPLKNGIMNVRPVITYRYIYPFCNTDIPKLAYHFDFDYSDGRDPYKYIRNLRHQILTWKGLWNDGEIPVLSMYQSGERVIITDTRPCATQTFHILSGKVAKIYEICDRISSTQNILSALMREYPLTSESEILEILKDLLNKKLIIYSNNRYVSLAVPILEQTRL